MLPDHISLFCAYSLSSELPLCHGMWYTTTVKKPHARNPDGEATSFPLGLNSGAGLGEEVTFASQELPAARQLSATRDLAQHPPPPSSGGWHRNGTGGPGGNCRHGHCEKPSHLTQGREEGEKKEERVGDEAP